MYCAVLFFFLLVLLSKVCANHRARPYTCAGHCWFGSRCGILLQLRWFDAWYKILVPVDKVISHGDRTLSNETRHTNHRLSSKERWRSWRCWEASSWNAGLSCPLYVASCSGWRCVVAQWSGATSRSQHRRWLARRRHLGGSSSFLERSSSGFCFNLAYIHLFHYNSTTASFLYCPVDNYAHPGRLRKWGVSALVLCSSLSWWAWLRENTSSPSSFVFFTVSQSKDDVSRLTGVPKSAWLKYVLGFFGSHFYSLYWSSAKWATLLLMSFGDIFLHWVYNRLQPRHGTVHPHDGV